MFASLSDGAPQNIKFGYGPLTASKSDPYTGVLNLANGKSHDSLFYGDIPGDGIGHSCGSLGGMDYLGDHMFAATYYRKACTTSLSSNDVTEIGLIFAYTTFSIIARTTIVPDLPNVNVLKSTRYGLYILVIYGTTQEIPEIFPSRRTDPTDTMNVLLVSVRGTVKTASTIVTPYILTANDDLEVLSDGSVVWGSVNEDGHYVLHRLPISENPVFLQYFNEKNKKDLYLEEENHESDPKLVKQRSGKFSRK